MQNVHLTAGKYDPGFGNGGIFVDARQILLKIGLKVGYEAMRIERKGLWVQAQRFMLENVWCQSSLLTATTHTRWNDH
jgi:hypothetical protein